MNDTLPTQKELAEQKVKDAIRFYITHLNYNDLRVLEATAHQLARTKKSYNDWLVKDENKS